MTPTALKRERLFTISDVAKGRNHFSRTRPTLWPCARMRRIGTCRRRARVVEAERDGWRHALVLGDAPRHEREVERLLGRLCPRHEPTEVAHGERVVVLGAERTGIVERAVAADGDDG